MAEMQNLKALNKSSARIITCAVRLCDGEVVTYTYTKKDKDKTEVTAHKFEVTLVGKIAQEYCKGYVKGTKGQCEKAAEKFQNGSVWALSKVAFDTYTSGQYISTPVPFRVDLDKSSMIIRDSENDQALRSSMPLSPVPLTSVADVTRITTNRSTDLIAVIKDVGDKVRLSKTDEKIIDVVLVDNTLGKGGKLALIDVSVFGEPKINQLKAAVGTPMAFFNLSVACGKAGEKPKITHYSNDKIAPAPECTKTHELRQKASALQAATDTEKLTQEWVPNQPRDVSGPQTLSCAAFLDYTKETPQAAVPSVSQLMWVHIEEPLPEEAILKDDRIWFVIPFRDISGPVSVGIPQRCALELAKVSDKAVFVQKHAAGELNFPLFCHTRISRNTRQGDDKDGASQPVYVNHSLEAVEPVSWDPLSAPNAAYKDVLAILNNSPPNDEGIVFAYLADIQPDPFCGIHISYDGSSGPKGVYAAVLVACDSKSKTHAIGNEGYKVVSSSVKDIAKPEIWSRLRHGAARDMGPVGDHTLVGYCNMDNLAAFRLDPPRGKQFRVAIVLINRLDDEGFHIHKLEIIEPDQVDNAITCMQKLRRMGKHIRPSSSEKRSHKLNLDVSATKKARTLKCAPTDGSLDDVPPTESS